MIRITRILLTAAFGLLSVLSVHTAYAQSVPTQAAKSTSIKVFYTITDLGTLGGSFSAGTSINDRGQVVGISSISGDTTGTLVEHAFLYSAGHMQDLGTLGGSFSEAYGINNHGQVVGGSNLNSGDTNQHAFLYSAGHMQDLGTLGGIYSSASSINARGRVVGASSITGDTTGAVEHAFLYSAGNMQDLGTLGGTSSSASSINDWGQVVGFSSIPGDTSQHAFLYSAGHMQDLGTLGGSLSLALAINNHGQVLGRSTLVIGFSKLLYPFLYSDGRMANLNSLLPPNSGWTLTEALSINDTGQIVGIGVLNGQGHAFLLTPLR